MIDIFNTNSPEWMLHEGRNCATPEQYDTPEAIGAWADRWHPSPIHEPRATKLCRGCPVQTACLKFALDDPDLDGVWGATTTAQRNSMRQGVVA